MQLSLQNFKLLHCHLLTILSTNNFENERLPQKIMQYIGMIVQSEKNPGLNQDIFDYFCQHEGNKIMRLTLEVDPMLSVRILSMLFINLTSHYWISYLLCQPYIIDAIQYDDIPNYQQWPEYYISLLKSLTIRLNQQQLSLFYNKKFCKFPLLYESLKYYNHPDCMVRTNVMNIILGIMKIKDQRLSKYLGRFPFTSYILTYCLQIKFRIDSLNAHLSQISQVLSQSEHQQTEKQILLKQKHKDIIKSYYIDLIDYICYLNDLMDLGSPELAYFVQNCIYVYILMPTLEYLMTDCQLLVSSVILLAFVLLKNITNQKFKQNLCLILLSKQLPSFILSNIATSPNYQPAYIPKVYSESFLPNDYYWNKFEYQINNQCLKLFEDVKDFQTDHESIQEDKQKAKEFKEELAKISAALGFDVLTYKQDGDRLPISELASVLKLSQHHNKPIYLSIPLNIVPQSANLAMQPNPLRESLYTHLHKTSSRPTSDPLLLAISMLLNTFMTCESINNQILKYCGILFPRLDTVNFKDQYNLSQIERVRQIGISFVEAMEKGCKSLKGEEQSGDIKVDLDHFSIQTIKSMLILLYQSIYKQLSPAQQQSILCLYKSSLLNMKSLLTKRNMKTIVQNFQLEYTKWNKDAFFHSNTLNQNILTWRRSAKELHSDTEANESNVPEGCRMYFRDHKEVVLYHMRKMVIMQAFVIRYSDNFIFKTNHNQDQKQQEQQIRQQNCDNVFRNLNLQKYTTLHIEKYSKVQQTYKLNQSYQIGYKHMVQCTTQTNPSDKKSKSQKKLILVQDPHNLLVVEPSKSQNVVRIIINHPWKYVVAEIDRETGRKMTIKLNYCYRGDNKIQLFFENETRNASTLQWMNGLKYQRYQAEQAFILSYIRNCIGKL